ncbi:MAG TPA: sn-glycerol-3-phosphate import ATP-binding protein UgpC [Burkholderiaceae bacterium]|nr:sn-glycerol-3-phosphate import ATP-binding protein UgpC [Burkholderiaceae bacterium]
MATVEIRNVKKSYAKQEVVHGVSLSVEPGEFVVIVGPSGCGKSTLLRMVAGLEEISAGEIAIGGRVVNRLEPKDRDIAMVFQNYALYPHMNVYDNMAYGLRNRGMPKAEIDTRVREAARILELDALLERKPRQLSGGQRQRVAMGRAIVRHPKVFLFDEPLSNLDAKLRVQMRLELQKLHRRLGVTSLYVTHDQVEAMTLGNRIVVMNAGRAEQIGTPAEIYARPATTFVAAFIGSPPMNLLPGQVDGDARLFQLGVGNRVALPAPVNGLAGRRLAMGLRPEALRLGGDAFEIEVDMVESLGADHLIHGHAGDHALIVRAGPDANPALGSRVGVGFDARALHWFDQESGARVEK